MNADVAADEWVELNNMEVGRGNGAPGGRWGSELYAKRRLLGGGWVDGWKGGSVDG